MLNLTSKQTPAIYTRIFKNLVTFSFNSLTLKSVDTIGLCSVVSFKSGLFSRKTECDRFNAASDLRNGSPFTKAQWGPSPDEDE